MSEDMFSGEDTTSRDGGGSLVHSDVLVHIS